MKIEIRKPVAEEAGQIVKVNIETWKTTYRGIVSDDYLDSLCSNEKRIDWTIEQIQNTNPYVIALANGEIVGMLSYGKCREERYIDSGEIYAIYVLKKYQGLGIGKKMFLEAVKYLIHDKYDSMIIACLVGNPSNNFYINMGGELDNQTECIIDGKSYGENIYYFNMVSRR